MKFRQHCEELAEKLEVTSNIDRSLLEDLKSTVELAKKEGFFGTSGALAGYVKMIEESGRLDADNFLKLITTLYKSRRETPMVERGNTKGELITILSILVTVIAILQGMGAFSQMNFVMKSFGGMNVSPTIFWLAIIADLGLVLLASYLGRSWLIAFMVTNLICVNILSAKAVNIFGFDTTMGTFFYAAVFLSTDILTERHSKNAGAQAVYIGFFSIFVFHLIAQSSRLVQPMPNASEVHESLDLLFSPTFRIMIASVVAYFISQRFDVWLYHKIKVLSKDRRVWLRNNGSTMVSQLLDSIIFFGIAFVGQGYNIFEMILTGYVVKLFASLLDTPFMYFSVMLGSRKKHEE